MKIEDDGSFKIKRSSNKSAEINLYAHDSEGNNAELFLNVKILLASSKFINDKKYYALIIGNNDYDNKEWDDLESPPGKKELRAGDKITINLLNWRNL